MKTKTNLKAGKKAVRRENNIEEILAGFQVKTNVKAGRLRLR